MLNTYLPGSLKAEHEELNAQLEKAVGESGPIGTAAREVARLLYPHFQKEEQFAIPPLALLPKLAWGTVTDEMASVLPITRRLKAELPLMLIEHKEITAASEKLRKAAQECGKSEYERYAVALLLHAREEEEVLYPAAVLVGEYLELKLHHLELT
ncbi:MAG: hemerythrin domain-containing protein [Burkholderiales bacterium]